MGHSDLRGVLRARALLLVLLAKTLHGSRDWVAGVPCVVVGEASVYLNLLLIFDSFRAGAAAPSRHHLLTKNLRACRGKIV